MSIKYKRGAKMFKIAKLEKLENEKVKIINNNTYISFDIEGIINDEEYSFSFSLNCGKEELSELVQSKEIDFNKYILPGETFLNVNGIQYINPMTDFTYDVKICRWLQSKYIINLSFFSEEDIQNSNIYSGKIEFEFDVDDL